MTISNSNNLAKLREGLRAVANDFFFIKEGAETGIEQSYQTIIKSPKEITGLIVTPEML